MDREAFMSAVADALAVEPDALSESTELNDDNWDSLAHMAAIAAIDEKFGVTVPAKDLTAVRSIGELMTLVERSLASRPAGS
jgi:acyl carrier protein